MEANEFIDVMLRDLHGGLRADIEPLTQEQLVHQPAGGANTVAFLLWHATRFEDNMLRRQHGEDSLWTAEGWHERLGLEPSDTGTGFSEEQVLAFQPAKEELLAYVERVWEATPDLVARLSAEKLGEAPNPERPRMTVGRSLANFVVGHGWIHLGDIRFTKGLMGMPFSR
jgi:uncharacterized damage-inducible protein DinB